MFSKLYPSDNKDFCLHITITCKGKKKFRAWAEDRGQANAAVVKAIEKSKMKFEARMRAR